MTCAFASEMQLNKITIALESFLSRILPISLLFFTTHLLCYKHITTCQRCCTQKRRCVTKYWRPTSRQYVVTLHCTCQRTPDANNFADFKSNRKNIILHIISSWFCHPQHQQLNSTLRSGSIFDFLNEPSFLFSSSRASHFLCISNSSVVAALLSTIGSREAEACLLARVKVGASC